MQIPILRDAPVVSARARNFRDIFANTSQYNHFKDYLTGLIVLDKKSFANISTCVVDSSDATNLGRFFSNRDWDGKLLNEDRIRYMIRT